MMNARGFPRHWLLVADLLLMMMMSLGEAQKVLTAFNLTCWACSLETHGEACLTMNESLIERRACSDEKKYCKVKRTYTNNVIDVFERDCVAECNPGCVSVGNSNRYTIGQCITCCNNSLCNVGRGGAARRAGAPPSALAVWAAAVAVTMLTTMRVGGVMHGRAPSGFC